MGVVVREPKPLPCTFRLDPLHITLCADRDKPIFRALAPVWTMQPADAAPHGATAEVVVSVSAAASVGVATDLQSQVNVSRRSLPLNHEMPGAQRSVACRARTLSRKLSSGHC